MTERKSLRGRRTPGTAESVTGGPKRRPSSSEWDATVERVVRAGPSRADFDEAIRAASTVLNVTLRAVRQRVNHRVRHQEWHAPFHLDAADCELIQDAPDFASAYHRLGQGRELPPFVVFDRAVRRAGRCLAGLVARENRVRALARKEDS